MRIMIRHFKAFLHAAIGLSLCAVALPTKAQETQVLQAPRIQEEGRTLDVAISIWGRGRWPDRNNPPLRAPMPHLDLTEWFAADSPLVLNHMAEPNRSGWVWLKLEISPVGKIAACTIGRASELWPEPETLCGQIADQAFMPALGNDGAPIVGEFRLDLSKRRRLARPGTPSVPLFSIENDVIPVPEPMPSPRSVRSFPPENYWVSRYGGEPEWKSPPLAGLEGTALTGNETGLVLHAGGFGWRKEDGVQCYVVASSGDGKQDEKACRYAVKKLAPNWADASRRKERAVPLYVRRDKRRFVAFGRAEDRVKRTSMSDEVERTFVGALTEAGLLQEGREASDLQLQLTASSDGAITHCRVVRSTGTDAGDISACGIAKSSVRLRVLENAFGVPYAKGRLFWSANCDAK